MKNTSTTERAFLSKKTSHAVLKIALFMKPLRLNMNLSIKNISYDMFVESMRKERSVLPELQRFLFVCFDLTFKYWTFKKKERNLCKIW